MVGKGFKQNYSKVTFFYLPLPKLTKLAVNTLVCGL